MNKIYKGFGRTGLAAIFSYLEFKSGAEIGVEGGNFSHILAKYNRNAKLYSIDSWHNEAYYQKALKRLSPLGNVEIIRQASVDALMLFGYELLDYVYIDANHSYGSVSFDIEQWSMKVRSGGIVAGHDYSSSEPGVKIAVKEYADRNGIEDVYILTCNSWYWVKP